MKKKKNQISFKNFFKVLFQERLDLDLFKGKITFFLNWGGMQTNSFGQLTRPFGVPKSKRKREGRKKTSSYTRKHSRM